MPNNSEDKTLISEHQFIRNMKSLIRLDERDYSMPIRQITFDLYYIGSKDPFYPWSPENKKLMKETMVNQLLEALSEFPGLRDLNE